MLKPFPSEKKSFFCPFLEQNENFQKSDMGIKIWVFDAAEYDGALEFLLKTLPSEKSIIFWHFLEKKLIFQKNKMGIKIRVFDAAEYGGRAQFKLKPLPSKIKSYKHSKNT